MTMSFRHPWIAMSLVLVVLIGCDGTKPAVVSDILPAPNDTPIPPKTELSLNVQVSGAGPIEFRWSATRGEISDPTRPAILYTAPSSPGPDTVTVEVIGKGWSTFKTRNFEVGPAAPSPTSVPAGNGVTLTAPQEGESVHCQILAQGTYPLNLTEKIWPVVLVGSRYHPQDEGGRAPHKASGKWRGTVRFGDCITSPSLDKGIPFTLLVVTANDQANQVFEDYVRNAAPDFAGLPALPPGADPQAEVAVVRQ